ncbi:MAG: prepilin-type N-terminal cleavage/methylation domain-containing protein [Patescibacteria group bacterium]
MRKQMLKAMTLMEVLVAIAVMLIAMEGFTLLFVKSWDTNKFILEEGLASAAASRATNKIIGELRHVRQADNGDYPVESGSDFDLKVYLDVDKDGVTERVHYFLDQDTDELKKGVTNPLTTQPISYPAGDDSVSVLTNYVVNESTDPVFYYYNENYPGDTANNPIATPAAVDQVRLIRVHLFVNINPVHAPDNINIESFADLRNLNSL